MNVDRVQQAMTTIELDVLVSDQSLEETLVHFRGVRAKTL